MFFLHSSSLPYHSSFYLSTFKPRSLFGAQSFLPLLLFFYSLSSFLPSLLIYSTLLYSTLIYSILLSSSHWYSTIRSPTPSIRKGFPRARFSITLTHSFDSHSFLHFILFHFFFCSLPHLFHSCIPFKTSGAQFTYTGLLQIRYSSFSSFLLSPSHLFFSHSPSSSPITILHFLHSRAFYL